MTPRVPKGVHGSPKRSGRPRSLKPRYRGGRVRRGPEPPKPPPSDAEAADMDWWLRQAEKFS